MNEISKKKKILELLRNTLFPSDEEWHTSREDDATIELIKFSGAATLESIGILYKCFE